MSRDISVNQEIGERVIDVLVAYAREKIPMPSKLANEWFMFIVDEKLRTTLSETLYGAMWVYRIGKVFATDREELQAHLRTQLINYGAICEVVLEYSILQSAKQKLLKGEFWKYRDEKMKQKLQWSSTPANLPRGTSFVWCIRVATEEGMIQANLEKELTKLRELRNSIHLNKKATDNLDYEPRQSKEAFELMKLIVDQSKCWLSDIAPSDKQGSRHG